MTYETGRPTTADPSAVSTRDGFAEFMFVALADFRKSGQTEWENGTLESYLDGLAAFAQARVAGGGDQRTATWRLFAEMMAAATGYE